MQQARVCNMGTCSYQKYLNPSYSALGLQPSSHPKLYSTPGLEAAPLLAYNIMVKLGKLDVM
jgi:hypothetical protein